MTQQLGSMNFADSDADRIMGAQFDNLKLFMPLECSMQPDADCCNASDLHF